MRKKLLVFDFDGTIADTLLIAEQILNETGHEFGLPPVSREQIMQYKHLSLTELMNLSGLKWVQLPVFIRRARSGFKRHMGQVKPIEGMPDVLRELARTYRMGILTSNSEEGVRAFLTQHDLQLFEFIHSPSSLFGKGKRLKKILKAHSLQPDDLIMIGDEQRDIEAAHQAGIDSIAVTWGFNGPHLLRAVEPTYLSETPRELLDLFARSEAS
ncbi:MAG: HAD family hydrolase [Bacteroidia bacterium]